MDYVFIEYNISNMDVETAKSIAGLLMSIMTFLGWSPSEYSYLLPTKISINLVSSSKTEIPKVETVSTTTSIKKTSVNEKQNSNGKKGVTQNTDTSKKHPTKKTTITLTTPTQTKVVKQTSATTSTKINFNLPVLVPKNNTVTSNTDTKKIIDTSVPKVTVTTPTPTPTVPTVPEKSNLTAEEKIKKSIVNIYCSRVLGNRIQKTTGSGVMIDSSGVILTNSHVAEYFLLAENGNNTNCFIRTDSPAANSYKAKLVYMPKTWVEKNKNNLSQLTVTGTGEYDYALLVITDRVKSSAPNIPLAFLNIGEETLVKKQKINIAGYPAGFSDVKLLDTALYLLVRPSEITNIAGFDRVSRDVINTSPTVLAEHGSSGGAITNEDGDLIALIVATTIDSYTGGKNLQAITLEYIKKNIETTSGNSLTYFINNAHAEADNFEKNSVSVLANILVGN
jgi:Trypsin-like peptidase domain